MRMTRAQERELIEQVIDGDRDAAEIFIRTFQPSLYAYMLRLSGRPDVAEDVVQDAFVRALTNLHRFDFRFRFSTWLFTIAKRLYVNACQKHKPAYDSEIVGRWESSRYRPEDALGEDEVHATRKEALEYALSMLGEEQREIVILFHQLEWPITLIAEHMEMPEGTIKSHLHRGRRKMREALEQHKRYSTELAEVWL